MAQQKVVAEKKPAQTVAENKPAKAKKAAPPKEKKQEVGTVKQGVGRVKWYNMDKGYGFIMLYPEYLLDCGDDQILVLKSSIRSEPARGLKEHEIVDFEIGLALDGKEVAVNLLRLSDCYTCGKDGHIQRNCPLTHPCRRCNQLGHMSKDCPNPTTNGGDYGNGNGNGRSSSNNNGDGMCYNCKEVGHMARDCVNPCRKCNESGHMPKDCPNSKANGNRNANGNGSSVRECFKCGDTSHIARDCAANPPKRA